MKQHLTLEQLQDYQTRLGIEQYNGLYQIVQKDGSLCQTSDINELLYLIKETYENKLKSCGTIFSKKVPYEIKNKGHILKNEDDTYGRVKASHCKSRLCPRNHCIEERKNIVINNIKPCYEEADEICSVTLTIQNLPANLMNIKMKKKFRTMFNKWLSTVHSRRKVNILTGNQRRVRRKTAGLHTLEFKQKYQNTQFHVHYHVHFFDWYPDANLMRSLWQKLVKNFMTKRDYDAFVKEYNKKPGFVDINYNYKNKNGRRYTKAVKAMITYGMMDYMAIKASTSGLSYYDRKHGNHVPMDTIDFLLLVKNTRVINRFGEFNNRTKVRLDYIETSKKREREEIGLYDLGSCINPNKLNDPPPDVYESVKYDLDHSKEFIKREGEYYLRIYDE